MKLVLVHTFDWLGDWDDLRAKAYDWVRPLIPEAEHEYMRQDIELTVRLPDYAGRPIDDLRRAHGHRAEVTIEWPV